MTHRSDSLRTTPRFLVLAAVVVASTLALASARAQQERTNRSDRSSGRDDSTQSADQSTQYQQRQRTDQYQNADRSNQDRDARTRDSQGQQYNQQSSDRYQRQQAQGTDRSDRQASREQSRDQSDRGDQNRSSLRQRLGLSFDQQRQGQGGLLINDVQQGTTAAGAGLRPGDQIVAVDGRNVSSPQQFFAYLGGQSGRPIPLTVNRQGRQYTIQLQADQGGGNTAWLGVFLQESEGNEEGAQITQVYPAGPAARAGLRPGDVITQVDGQRVRSSAELISAIEEEQPGGRAQLTVSRNNQQLDLPVVLGSRETFTSFDQHDQWRGQGGGQYATSGQSDQSGGQSDRSGRSSQSQPDYFGNLPPFAMQLEHERRMYEQHQRIETEIAKLQDEVRQLREAVQQLRR